LLLPLLPESPLLELLLELALPELLFAELPLPSEPLPLLFSALPELADALSPPPLPELASARSEPLSELADDELREPHLCA